MERVQAFEEEIAGYQAELSRLAAIDQKAFTDLQHLESKQAQMHLPCLLRNGSRQRMQSALFQSLADTGDPSRKKILLLNLLLGFPQNLSCISLKIIKD